VRSRLGPLHREPARLRRIRPRHAYGKQRGYRTGPGAPPGSPAATRLRHLGLIRAAAATRGSAPHRASPNRLATLAAVVAHNTPHDRRQTVIASKGPRAGGTPGRDPGRCAPARWPLGSVRGRDHRQACVQDGGYRAAPRCIAARCSAARSGRSARRPPVGRRGTPGSSTSSSGNPQCRAGMTSRRWRGGPSGARHPAGPVRRRTSPPGTRPGGTTRGHGQRPHRRGAAVKERLGQLREMAAAGRLVGAPESRRVERRASALSALKARTRMSHGQRYAADSDVFDGTPPRK
jgi:hypothetical protein